MVDISLSAPFLLKAAKQVDMQLRAPRQSSHHSVIDPKDDIEQMVTHILEKEVTISHEHRTGKPFNDPLIMGSEKVGSGLIEKYIASTDDDYDVNDELHVGMEETDLDYELYHTD